MTEEHKRTTFVVKDKKLGTIPLSYWCKMNGARYNTILARVWRAGLSGNEIGLVELFPCSKHKEIFKQIRAKKDGRKKAKEGMESEICS